MEALHKAQTLAQAGLADVRRSGAALRAAPHERPPLPVALGELVEASRTAGQATELIIAGTPRPLPPAAELTLFRATQEGLTNTHKHAQATRTDVLLDYRNDRLVRLVVQDNGAGATDAEGGFGLHGIRERVQLLGGLVQLQTAPGQGFRLAVEVPG